MIERKRKTLIGILIFFVLTITPLPVFAAQLVGSQFPIANDALQEVTPSLAYNSKDHQYLVVWSNDRPGNDDIRAQRLGADGSLIGGPFYISAGPGHDRWNPDVVYNRKHDQYLVVWEDFDSVSVLPWSSVRARRVSGTGSVLDATDVVIAGACSWDYLLYEPAVAYASASDRYLVVWMEIDFISTPSKYSIKSQVVTHQGNLEGLAEVISSSTRMRFSPDLAYNHRENRYMVAWTEYNNATKIHEIKGKQVEGNGNLWGSIASYGSSGLAYQGPAVAALPNSASDKTYMIAWIYKDNTFNGKGYDYVYVNQAGVMRSHKSWHSSYSMDHIAVSANPNSKTFLLAYGLKDCIKILQEDVLTNFLNDFWIHGHANDFPAIAAGPTGDYLVTWQGQPPSITHTNINGQIIGNRSYLPLIKR